MGSCPISFIHTGEPPTLTTNVNVVVIIVTIVNKLSDPESFETGEVEPSNEESVEDTDGSITLPFCTKTFVGGAP